MHTKVCLENGWNSKLMIMEGDAAILLETTRRAFRNQEQSKERSAIVIVIECQSVAISPDTTKNK